MFGRFGMIVLSCCEKKSTGTRCGSGFFCLNQPRISPEAAFVFVVVFVFLHVLLVLFVAVSILFHFAGVYDVLDHFVEVFFRVIVLFHADTVLVDVPFSVGLNVRPDVVSVFQVRFSRVIGDSDGITYTIVQL